MKQMKETKVAISGIQATGNLTLGNYLGAIKNFVAMQDKLKLYAFVADLHSLTGDVDPSALNDNITNVVAIYLAAGLDPQKTTIFKQSSIYEHAMMQWLLTNQTSVGELSRMTQYKDKIDTFKMKNKTNTIPTGLLTYPTLMAADILLYNADLVPVGKDQKQHLELTKTIAQRINKKYHLDFKIPEGYIPQHGAKIMSLVEPKKKMSKSALKTQGTIFLLDDVKKSQKKIMSALTDSEGKIYASENKPGISNLLEIYSLLSHKTVKQLEEEYKDQNYGVFKGDLATVLGTFLTDLQAKYYEALKNVNQVLEKGRQEAQAVANGNLKKLLLKLGLLKEKDERYE